MPIKSKLPFPFKTKKFDTPFEALVEKVTPAFYKEMNFQSLNWYRKKVREAFGIGQDSSLSDPVTKFRSLNPEWNKRVLTSEYPGWFYSFTYDPKHKKTLPFYDRFPFILMLEIYEDGFLGLNMHYLYPVDRARFMSKLYQFHEKDPIPNNVRIAVTYDILKSMNSLAYYKPCLKRYLTSHIGSLFIPIYREEWEIALFLPTEKFTKKNSAHVFEDSRSKYRGLV